MAVEHYLTKQEVENSTEFKAFVRALKTEFPWIVDVKVPETNELNQYNLIFLEAIINPFIFRSFTGFDPQLWTLTHLKKKIPQSGPYLSTMFDMSYEDEKELFTDKMEELAKQIHTTKIIPDHLKLPKSRKPHISYFNIPGDTPLPKDFYIDAEDLWTRLDRIRKTN